MCRRGKGWIQKTRLGHCCQPEQRCSYEFHLELEGSQTTAQHEKRLWHCSNVKTAFWCNEDGIQRHFSTQRLRELWVHCWLWNGLCQPEMNRALVCDPVCFKSISLMQIHSSLTFIFVFFNAVWEETKCPSSLKPVSAQKTFSSVMQMCGILTISLHI